MKKDSKKWDSLSARFNTGAKKLNASAADQMVIVWPVIFDIIKRYCDSGNGHALDFGCGTGGFCNELAKRGFKVIGIDFSKEMIEIAGKSSGSDVEYIVGDESALFGLNKKFELVTSIMVLQFIEDISKIAGLFADILEKNGLAMIVVINPDFVRLCIEQGIRYSDLKGKNAIMAFEEASFAVFVRERQDYESTFAKAGFELLDVQKPEFPKAFAEKYGWKLPIGVPEFLIMAFKKKP